MSLNPVERFVSGLARYVAIAGGLALVATVILIVLSVIGRALIPLGLGAITGDYELVEAGVGFAVFAFLPWAHLTRGHAVVSIFTDMAGPRFNAWLMVVCDALMLAVAVFITWRQALGAMDKFAYGETTLLLRMPLWWSYTAGLIGAVTFVLVAAYLLAVSLSDAATGRQPQAGQGAVH
ncbi:TRAP transporter small permease [Devosia sp. BSSL-BM10]|uniref:TRAP transporter small permease protein n=1 Tax=Devosia litorisediminis TaxID=2829817 RepID=A0A942EEE9_9HYPH|nr:TRAP transporter small permease [Devosia litorisediminis]MBS3849724.1 TRAP transporter small permease [Devosia litorisediminis]